MDVTCERCSTAYEFDALVSERGTTVKCTNCGHQFKVRRNQEAGPPERWVVRTIDGREIEFRALRELQTAIAHAQISREDVLARGGSRPRRLGSIAELEPFFAGVAQPSAHPTSLGLGGPRGRAPSNAAIYDPPTANSVAIPLPTAPRELNGLDDDTMVMPPALAPRPPTIPPRPPPRRSVPPAAPVATPPPASVEAPRTRAAEVPRTLPVPLDDSMPPPARIPADLLPPPSIDPATTPRPRARLDLAQTLAAEQSAPPPKAVPQPMPSDPTMSPLGRHSQDPMSPRASVPPATPTPSMARASMLHEDTYGEPRFSVPPPRRAGAARWIVGLVVAGMSALAFATVGRRFLAPAPAASTAPGDERIGALVQDGEKSLLDGDLEAAQEQFSKASALGERNPRVAADLARLAMVRSDVAWLRVRLLPDGDPDLDTAKRELDQAAERAKKAANLAAELAPGDPRIVRARIDALRLAADLDGARKLVGGIAAASSEPDNALALAELDLAEAKPDWPTVIGRLRTALAGDHNLGRARAMLIYALARSGDPTAAKAELERLSALTHPHPLLRPLRAYVGRAEGLAAAESSAGKPPTAKSVAVAGAGAPWPKEHAPEVSGGGSPRPIKDDPPVVVGGSGEVDTSDLPSIKTAPTPPVPKDPPAGTSTPTAAPTPAPTPTTPTMPPGVDTSDLPGFK